MHKGIIDFYDFRPLSVFLTLAGGHNVRRIRDSLLHFLTHFSTDQVEIWCVVEVVDLNILILHFSEIVE